MKRKLYLIDGNAYIYRGYHALPALSNSKGLPTNAILGFINIITKLFKEKNPEYAIMLFDAKGPTFRHEMYQEYKANRPPMPEDLAIQLPYIREVTKGFNIPMMEMVGFEADDLIGTYAKLGENSGFSVIMVSGDKDLMQLVSENIIMYDPMKDMIIDREKVKEKIGVFPELVTDVMGLTGDSSDNVPGVPGIGKKTAPKLINMYGSIKSLYGQVDNLKKNKMRDNLINYKEQAFLSKKLVTIDTDIELPFETTSFLVKKPDNDFLSDLFKELEFKKYQQQFSKEKAPTKKKYYSILDKDSLADLISKLNSSSIFAVDTETTSKTPMAAKLVGISFSIVPDEAFYIPLAHDYAGAPEQLDMDETLDALKPILESEQIKKIGQNIKYDWIVLKRHGVNLKGVEFDTMLASYLLNPSIRSHSLDQIAMDLLGHKTIKYEDVTGKGKKAINFSQVEIEIATPYACEDSDITLKIYEILSKKLEENGLTDLFKKLEMPLVEILTQIEMAGINIDKEKLIELSKTFGHELDLLQDQIFSHSGEEFNINSSQQLGKILFEKLGLPVQKKTKKKTGYSTDVDVLTALQEMHELPGFILKHRTLSKLKSTYTDSLMELTHSETNRIHTSFNQTVTATGRLSSSGPNLQNIPIRTDEGKEIRKAFIPKNGWKLLAADYSQIELRILAHYSNDEILIKAFIEGEDIHTRTASEVFQVFPSFIDTELRRQAKAINFGIIYGMSPFGLSKELNISQKMAKEYINNYFNRYKGVKNFIETTIESTKKTEKTTTLLGRIRNLPDINSTNKRVQQFAERIAINTPIQGSAADLIKLAMINVELAIREKSLQAQMLLSVHDEIIFETPENEMDILSEVVKKEMESVWDLKVPLLVNIGNGKNWAEAH